MPSIMLFAVFQGLLLLLALSNKKQRNIPANRVLIGLISAICFLLAMIATSQSSNLLLTQDFGYLTDSVSLLYGPLFYFYVLRLLEVSNKPIWPHLTPFLLFVIFNTLWLVIGPDPQMATLRSNFYLFMTTSSLAQIITYLILSWRVTVRYRLQIKSQRSYHPSLRYLQVLIVIISSCVILFSTNYFGQQAGYQLNLDFLDYHVTWLLLSAFIFTLAYYAIRQPEIFRLEPAAVYQNETSLNEMDSAKDLSPVLERLTEILQNERPYLDPELSLEALARKVGCRKEILSKVINQGLNMNFYQLVNEYRIKAFEALAQDKSNAHLTHLALAYEAGFRSKTTFYKAFKELKQSSPSAYLKNR